MKKSLKEQKNSPSKTNNQVVSFFSKAQEIKPFFWSDDKKNSFFTKASLINTPIIKKQQSTVQDDNFKPYPTNIEKGLKKKEQWAYTEAAKWDIKYNQVSFKRMDELESHDNTEFNSYHFQRVVDFYMENAKKEVKGNKGETIDAWKQCSPAMYFAMNKLYNWSEDDKIKSGYVVDYTDDKEKTTKGIVTLMKEKNLVGAEKRFVAIDKDGKAGHYSDKNVIKMNTSVAGWAKNKTAINGVGVFLVSAIGGYHSLTLVVDRRGKDNVSFWLLDQHGNSDTGSGSSFDRTVKHTKKEIDDYFVIMALSWGNTKKNHSFNLFELKRD